MKICCVYLVTTCVIHERERERENTLLHVLHFVTKISCACKLYMSVCVCARVRTHMDGSGEKLCSTWCVIHLQIFCQLLWKIFLSQNCINLSNHDQRPFSVCGFWTFNFSLSGSDVSWWCLMHKVFHHSCQSMCYVTCTFSVRLVFKCIKYFSSVSVFRQ